MTINSSTALGRRSGAPKDAARGVRGRRGLMLVLTLLIATIFGAEAAEQAPAIKIEIPRGALTDPALAGMRDGTETIRGLAKPLAAETPAALPGADKPGTVEGPAICKVEVSRYNTVNIHAQNVLISTVLQELSVKSGKNIILAAGADRMVSMTLYSVPFQEALRVILDVNGLNSYEENGFIEVYTKDQLAHKVQGKNGMTSRVFRLNYLRPKDAKAAASDLLSKDGKATTIEDDAPQTKDTDMSVTGAKKQDPVYQPETQRFSLTSALVVYDYQENVEAVGRLLQNLDKRPKQVLLEATVLQVAITENNAFGVDFSMLHKTNMLNFFDVKSSSGVPLQGSNYDVTHGGIISETSTDASNVTTSFRGGVAVQDFAVFIRALDQVSDVSVLASPKVLSLDRQRARVLVGQNVGYLETTFSDNQVVQSVKFIEAGISLDVRPYVQEGGKIRMVISPKVSKVTFNSVTISQGIEQKVPQEDIQTVAADVIIPQGATAVIGGLFQEKTQVDRSQIPVLGDVPVLGLGGRRQNDTASRSELVFMIRATILSDDEIEEIGKGTACDLSRVLAGHRQGLLVWSRVRQCGQMNLKASRYIRSDEGNLGAWMYRRSLQLRDAQPDVTQHMSDATFSGMRQQDENPLFNAIRSRIAQPGVAAQTAQPAPATLPVSRPAEGAPAQPTQATKEASPASPGKPASVTAAPVAKREPVSASTEAAAVREVTPAAADVLYPESVDGGKGGIRLETDKSRQAPQDIALPELADFVDELAMDRPFAAAAK